MKRTEILDSATNLVATTRQAEYGDAAESFGLISGLWSEYLGHDIKPADVCAMMVLLKLARAKHRPAHEDSWVDIAGYAALAAEVAT
jgi:hypothetical protein